MSIYKDMIRKLTDVFTKNENSNIGKILLIASEQIDQLNDAFTTIEDWRDINQAEGATLDAIGHNVGQQRGKASDEIMRILIKARVARNNSDGTFNKMIDALARALQTEPSTIKMRALYAEGEPAAIIIEGIPYSQLNKAGMTLEQFGFIAQKVAAAGVRVASIDIKGTFSFSSQANVSETSALGFAPVDQSSGGTLGAAYDPKEEITLPI